MSILASGFLWVAPWLLGLWLLAVGILLIWRPFARHRRGGGWQRAGAGVGLLMVLGAGLLGGSLYAHAPPPTAPEVVPLPGTRPDGTVAPPASDSPYERVIPVVPAGPRRISC